MKANINKVVDTTNGYKTKAAVLVRILLTLFGEQLPFMKDNEEMIILTVDALMVSGLLHDVWRNRRKIIAWIKNLFSKKLNK